MRGNDREPRGRGSVNACRASRYGTYESSDEALPGDKEVKDELSRLSV